MSPATVVAALAEALRAAPGRPLLTTYDDRSGERVELSVATFDNWVCKLANLFGAEWDLEPGELLSVRLPNRWQSASATVAAWTAGLTVTFAASDHAVRSLVDWADLAEEVPSQPDALLLTNVVGAGDPALTGHGGTASHADLVRRGRAAAEVIGLQPGGRLVTELDPATDEGVDAALLAPLVTGSSIVLLVGVSEDRRDRIASQERATCST